MNGHASGTFKVPRYRSFANVEFPNTALSVCHFFLPLAPMSTMVYLASQAADVTTL